MQYHGCRSNIKDRSKVTELEDKFDLLVDTNDVILERVGILLDEASGVNKNQQPVLPAGLQVPQTIVSSWNRKAGEYSKKTKSETFRLLHAKTSSDLSLSSERRSTTLTHHFFPKSSLSPMLRNPSLRHSPKKGGNAHKIALRTWMSPCPGRFNPSAENPAGGAGHVCASLSI